MNIDKAIEILQTLPLKDPHIFSLAHSVAIRLGIDALKLVKLLQDILPPPEALILPGETEEKE